MDFSLEATYYRTALLLGLIRGEVSYADGRTTAIAEWLQQFAQSASPLFRR
jgi:hypothetical protein